MSLIDGRNQITVHDVRGGSTVVAARETVRETAEIAARVLGWKVGPREIAGLAVGQVGIDGTKLGSTLSPDEDYELFVIGTTP